MIEAHPATGEAANDDRGKTSRRHPVKVRGATGPTTNRWPQY